MSAVWALGSPGPLWQSASLIQHVRQPLVVDRQGQIAFPQLGAVRGRRCFLPTVGSLFAVVARIVWLATAAPICAQAGGSQNRTGALAGAGMQLRFCKF